MTKRSTLPLFALTTSLFAGCIVDSELSGQNLESTSPPEPSAISHCVFSLASGQIACFAGFTEAITAATGGRITDAPADSRAAVADAGLRARIDALAHDGLPRSAGSPRVSGPLIGIEFRDRDFGGSSLALTAPFGTGCDGNFATNEYSVATLPSSWNDQISSFIGFSSCAEQLFAEANFQGSRTPIVTSMSYVGDAMNDRTSTILFF